MLLYIKYMIKNAYINYIKNTYFSNKLKYNIISSHSIPISMFY